MKSVSFDSHIFISESLLFHEELVSIGIFICICRLRNFFPAGALWLPVPRNSQKLYHRLCELTRRIKSKRQEVGRVDRASGGGGWLKSVSWWKRFSFSLLAGNPQDEDVLIGD